MLVTGDILEDLFDTGFLNRITFPFFLCIQMVFNLEKPVKKTHPFFESSNLCGV